MNRNQIFNFANNWIALLVLLLCCSANAAMAQQNPGNYNAQYRPQYSPNTTTGDFAPPSVRSANWPAQPIHVDPNTQQAGYELNFPDAEMEVQPMGDVQRIASRIKEAGSGFKETLTSWVSDASEPGQGSLAVGSGWFQKASRFFQGKQLNKTLGSLAVIIGGYFGLVWLMRRFNPRGSGGLPTEVVEVMGRTPFGHQQHLQLVRLGSKLLLLLNGPDGTHPIGEVNDPSEVEYLASLCPGGKSPVSSTASTAIRRAAETLTPRRRDLMEVAPMGAPASEGSSSQPDLQSMISQLRDVLNQGGSGKRNFFEA